MEKDYLQKRSTATTRLGKQDNEDKLKNRKLACRTLPLKLSSSFSLTSSSQHHNSLLPLASKPSLSKCSSILIANFTNTTITNNSSRMARYHSQNHHLVHHQNHNCRNRRLCGGLYSDNHQHNFFSSSLSTSISSSPRLFFSSLWGTSATTLFAIVNLVLILSAAVVVMGHGQQKPIPLVPKPPVLLKTAESSPYMYSRPTPFSPYYRPECDVIFPESAAGGGGSSGAFNSKPSSYQSYPDASPPVTTSYYHANIGGHGSPGLDLPLTANELTDYEPATYYHSKPPTYLTNGKSSQKTWADFFPYSSAPSTSSGALITPISAPTLTATVASPGGYKQYISSYGSSFSKRSSYIPGGHICIRYDDINRAVSEAKLMLGMFAPPYEIRELSSEFPKPVHVAKVAEILLKASEILATNLGLSREAILYALPRIDTYKTSIREICPTFLKPVKCEISKYRTLSGMCNNLDYPSWGSARSAMLRFLPPDYADALSAPRVAKNGELLPSARIVSFMLHQDVSDYDQEVTYLVVAWGQMLDHDLTFASQPKDKLDQSIQCCKYPPHQRHPSCYPISLPADDPFYKFFNRQCMDFVRIMPGVKPNCPLGPKHQSNSVSSYIDANFIYGNSQSTAKRLRTFVGGKLKSTSSYRSMGLKDLLPMKTKNPDSGCERSGRSRNMYCFDTGDQRSNEQLQLAVMHTIWLREHNRIADQLYSLNPHWNDEKLFQETRRIMGAIVQHISFNEFLPIVVGRKAMNKFGINLLKHGFYQGYSPKINPGIRVEFQGSAFRFGHSILPDTTDRYNKFHDKIESIRLSTMLRQPYELYRPGIVDTFIFGLVNQPAYRVDSQITTEVTNHLFEKPGEHFGLDLAAINVARAREMGIPGYNDLREYCGLSRLRRFEDLYGLIANNTIYRYANLYKHVDDIDFWTAGVAEYPLMGAMVGPTFSCIIAEQFAHVRSGDRFWYENEGWPSQFTPEQLTEIRKVKLARLLCENADDMETVQLYPMLAANPHSNPRVSCLELPTIDLTAWREVQYYGGGHVGSPLDGDIYKAAAAAGAAKAGAAKAKAA